MARPKEGEVYEVNGEIFEFPDFVHHLSILTEHSVWKLDLFPSSGENVWGGATIQFHPSEKAVSISVQPKPVNCVYIWCMTNNDASTLQNMHQPEVMYVHV
jgi:hypothetical protein